MRRHRGTILTIALVALCLVGTLSRQEVWAQITVFNNKTTFLAALSSPTIVDFSSVTGGAILTGNEFSAQGVTITHLDGGQLNVISSPPMDLSFAEAHFASLPNALSSSYANFAAPGYTPGCCNVFFNNANSDNIRFIFSPLVSAAGVFIGENDVNGVGVKFLDQEGSELYSAFFAPGAPLNGFVGIVSATPIAALEVVEAANDGDGIVIDDIIFQAAVDVSIDIKPGSLPNSINPRSKGVIPVAILTTDTFDATTVDPLSVTFGPNGAVEAHGQGHIEDADGDGDLDLVLHFRTQGTGIQCGDTSAALTGQTFSGQAIEGSDSIVTVGCK